MTGARNFGIYDHYIGYLPSLKSLIFDTKTDYIELKQAHYVLSKERSQGFRNRLATPLN